MNCEANTVGASEIKSFRKFEKELKIISKKNKGKPVNQVAKK